MTAEPHSRFNQTNYLESEFTCLQNRQDWGSKRVHGPFPDCPQKGGHFPAHAKLGAAHTLNSEQRNLLLWFLPPLNTSNARLAAVAAAIATKAHAGRHSTCETTTNKPAHKRVAPGHKLPTNKKTSLLRSSRRGNVASAVIANPIHHICTRFFKTNYCTVPYCTRK